MSSVVIAVLPKPTPDEWKVLRALEAAQLHHSYPTLLEIANAMRPPSNVATVHRAVQRLVLKGWLAHTPGRVRSIWLRRALPRQNE